jgi:hypothetical protein
VTVHGVGSWRAGHSSSSSSKHSLQAEEKGEECERAGPLKAMA